MFATVYCIFLYIGSFGCTYLHNVMRDSLTFTHLPKAVVVDLKVADPKGEVVGAELRLIGLLEIRRI